MLDRLQPETSTSTGGIFSSTLFDEDSLLQKLDFDKLAELCRNYAKMSQGRKLAGKVLSAIERPSTGFEQIFSGGRSVLFGNVACSMVSGMGKIAKNPSDAGDVFQSFFETFLPVKRD